MSWRALGIAAAVLLLPTPICAQVVQQPTFQFFTANTTVLAPDSGGGFMAGVNRGSRGSNQRGVPWLNAAPFSGRPVGNRAAAANQGAAATQVKAQIIDNQALDEQLRSGAGPAAETTAADTAARSAAARNMAAAPTDSIADIRRQQSAETEAAQSEHRSLLDKGKQALAENKPGVAKIYFQMVARRANGELREQALAELKQLNTSSARVATKRE